MFCCINLYVLLLCCALCDRLCVEQARIVQVVSLACWIRIVCCSRIELDLLCARFTETLAWYCAVDEARFVTVATDECTYDITIQRRSWPSTLTLVACTILCV